MRCIHLGMPVRLSVCPYMELLAHVPSQQLKNVTYFSTCHREVGHVSYGITVSLSVSQASAKARHVCPLVLFRKKILLHRHPYVGNEDTRLFQ